MVVSRQGEIQRSELQHRDGNNDSESTSVHCDCSNSCSDAAHPCSRSCQRSSDRMITRPGLRSISGETLVSQRRLDPTLRLFELRRQEVTLLSISLMRMTAFIHADPRYITQGVNVQYFGHLFKARPVSSPYFSRLRGMRCRKALNECQH
jgi:hypothetical protein